jgi:hypothetical protein
MAWDDLLATGTLGSRRDGTPVAGWSMAARFAGRGCAARFAGRGRPAAAGAVGAACRGSRSSGLGAGATGRDRRRRRCRQGGGAARARVRRVRLVGTADVARAPWGRSSAGAACPDRQCRQGARQRLEHGCGLSGPPASPGPGGCGRSRPPMSPRRRGRRGPVDTWFGETRAREGPAGASPRGRGRRPWRGLLQPHDERPPRGREREPRRVFLPAE